MKSQSDTVLAGLKGDKRMAKTVVSVEVKDLDQVKALIKASVEIVIALKAKGENFPELTKLEASLSNLDSTGDMPDRHERISITGV